MQDPSVTTKLAPPNLGPVCPRPRLYDALDRARERTILWVSGPAGAGKSTLVASYLKDRKLPCVWYEMDSRDRDVATLFYGLGQAAERLGHASQGPMPVWSTDHPEGALGFARRFFDTLFQRTATPALFVFDNCQEVSSDARLYELLRDGFAAIPQGIHIVMISRSGPVPLFARFLASSRMAVLGWDDLRLSAEETQEILRARAQDRGLSLTEKEATDLHMQSDGWVAGLVLALECLRDPKRRPDLHTTDTSQQVFNYLATEVFEHVDPDMQDFLIKSAMIPNMTGFLLDRLLHTEGSQHILTRLKTDNFFLHEYGASTAIYRYHPLFREFLWTRARESLGSEELGKLRRDAAQLLAEAGETEAAMELFEKIEDRTAAAALVVSEAPRLLHQGRSKTLREWVQKLPKDTVQKTPWLTFWAGMANLGSEPDQSVHFFQHAFDTSVAQGDEVGSWHAWCGLVQAHLFEGNDYRPLEPLTAWALQAERRGCGFPSTEIESKAVRNLALAINMFAPERQDLATYVDRALTLPNDPDAETVVLASLVYTDHGEMRRLTDVLTSWKHYKARNEISAKGQLLSAHASVLHALFRGDLSCGLEAVREGLEVAEKSGFFSLNGLFQTYAALAHIALGNRDEVELLTEEMAQEKGPSGRALEVGRYQFILSREAMLAGDVHRAQRHAEQAIRFVQRRASPFLECNLRLGLAEALHRAGQADAARHEITEVEPLARSIGYLTAQGTLLLQAHMTLSEQRDAQRADTLLEEALSLGNTWECVPITVPIRETLAGLCRRALKRGIVPDYTRELVHKFSLDVSTIPDAVGPTVVPVKPGRVAQVQPEFSKALREAMRRWHEASELAQNRLLDTRLVEQYTGPNPSVQARVQTLQNILSECVKTLNDNARTEPMYRALWHTYLEPASTQLLAADQAKMPFGTYRRHLAAGLKEVATRLWLHEQALQ
jgi:LuxR family transcriptional regulator, maltose regulon positive regulatory protein